MDRFLVSLHRHTLLATPIVLQMVIAHSMPLAIDALVSPAHARTRPGAAHAGGRWRTRQAAAGLR